MKILKDDVGPGAQEILVTYRVKNNETVAVTGLCTEHGD